MGDEGQRKLFIMSVVFVFCAFHLGEGECKEWLLAIIA